MIVFGSLLLTVLNDLYLDTVDIERRSGSDSFQRSWYFLKHRSVNDIEGLDLKVQWLKVGSGARGHGFISPVALGCTKLGLRDWDRDSPHLNYPKFRLDDSTIESKVSAGDTKLAG